MNGKINPVARDLLRMGRHHGAMSVSGRGGPHRWKQQKERDSFDDRVRVIELIDDDVFMGLIDHAAFIFWRLRDEEEGFSSWIAFPQEKSLFAQIKSGKIDTLDSLFEHLGDRLVELVCLSEDGKIFSRQETFVDEL